MSTSAVEAPSDYIAALLPSRCASRGYSDLGADYFDQLDRARIERHHVRRLEELGYTVTLTPAPAA